MKVYILFKEAIYRHECGGVFRDLEAGKEAGRHLIAAESDDHHVYELRGPYTLGKSQPHDLSHTYRKVLAEPEVVWQISRRGDVTRESNFTEQPA